MRRAELPPDSYSAAVLYFAGNGKHTFVLNTDKYNIISRIRNMTEEESI